MENELTDMPEITTGDLPEQPDEEIQSDEVQVKEKKSIFKKIADWKYLYLVLCFSIPFLVMFLIYAVIGTHPFGNSSVLTLDLQAQFVYYYEALRRLLTEGGSWLYSWGRTLGGEMMGMIDYYLASGFNIILVFFPKEKIADAIMFIQLAKIGSMGLTFGIYLAKTRKLNERLIIIFSTMYALCAYSVVELVNPMWLDVVLMLPLVVLGTELLVRKRKVMLYITALSISFITNYYIGYMVGIFTLIYFIYYYILVRPELLAQPKLYSDGDNAIKKFFRFPGTRAFLRIAVCTIFAVCISAFTLYTAYYSLQFGKNNFSNSSFALTLRFDLLDFFIKLLPGSYDSVRPTGYPMVYCGLLALICLPLFYASKNISSRHKGAATFVLGMLFLSMLLNPVDLVWHGFSAPNWLNYRYSFVFSFFLIVMAVDTINGLKKIKKLWIVLSVSFITALVLVIQKLDIVFKQDTKQIELSDAGCILLTVALALAYLVILLLMKKKDFKKPATLALACIVVFEMLGSSLLTVIALQTDVGVTKYNNYTSSNGTSEVYSSYNGGNMRIMNVVNQVLDSDDSFYRMESTVYRKNGGVNEPYAFGFNGISHSTSTLNADVIRMMNKLGYASQSHWTKYLGGTPISDALLGIKYVITRNDTLDANLYSVYKQGEEGYQIIKSNATIYALQNNKALSVAYGVSDDIGELTKYSTYPPYVTAMAYQNDLISNMLKDTPYAGTIFKGIAAGIDCENCTKGMFTQNHSYIDDNGEKVTAPTQYYKFTEGTTDAKVIFDFTSPVDGDIYFHFPTANFGKNGKVYVNGSYLTDYFGNETSCAMVLGEFYKGESVKVEIRMNQSELYFSKESRYYFYYIDYSAVNEAFSYLEDASFNIEKHGNDYLEGDIYLPEGQTTIFTTIPYDRGWNVYIDGKKVETFEVMDSLLAIKSTEGYHTLKFKYLPRNYVISGLISIFSIILLVFLWFVAYNKHVRKFVYCKVLKYKEMPEIVKDPGDMTPIGEYPCYDIYDSLDDEESLPNETKETPVTEDAKEETEVEQTEEPLTEEVEETDEATSEQDEEPKEE